MKIKMLTKGETDVRCIMPTPEEERLLPVTRILQSVDREVATIRRTFDRRVFVESRAYYTPDEADQLADLIKREASILRGSQAIGDDDGTFEEQAEQDPA